MGADLQGSLFGGFEEPALGPLGGISRTGLGRGAWVDVLPGWLAGADEVYGRLASEVPWQAERRQMYDRVVDVPRLLCFYGENAPLPLPVLDQARDALSAYYADELGEPFRTAGLCFYRDGKDSVAWHGDRIGRGNHEDTMVAILSVGEPRVLALRPRPGNASDRTHGGGNEGTHGGGNEDTRGGGQVVGSTVRYPLGHGDLIVMGGSCQRTWEHAIPKAAGHVGPRISIQFRPRGVR
ncbi:alkylated DNA repair dioxygenase AlkB [Kribbella aluminosa]|uniref:Alkylated DNA repair dioxygenase AlkB n=1 Tax=Kribbella aluminosa TaxID=416017 RepID=A0ABS4UKV5_9ACTN|nr:alpha-ketoglutarate-dependent dioxygenase AlkB [Kribbella aluminosa]MBP2352291.1 alkylated DNA repair dioxygenase AlkB [Kribbella aluminosa]